MKKTIIFLLSLMLTSLTAYAADYDIKWFGIDEENPRINSVDDEALVISDNGNLSRLYDINGTPLMDEWYWFIHPYNNECTVYRAMTDENYYLYDDASAEYIELLRQNGFRVYDDDEKYYDMLKHLREQGFTVDENEAISVDIEDIYDFKGNLIYQKTSKGLSPEDDAKQRSMEKLLIYMDDRTKLAVRTNEGELLTEYEYEYSDQTVLTNAPGYFELRNGEKRFIGNYITGDYVVIDSFAGAVLNRKTGLGIIEKTNDGKYVYYNEKLKQVTDLEFDEYLGNFNGSASFKKDGRFYVFDTEWQLAYIGDKEIKAVFFGNYVIENENGLYGLYDKSFNVIIPDKYSNILPVCENVCVAEADFEEYLYNQSNLVAEGLNSSVSDHFTDKGYIIAGKNAENNEIRYILDVEGNEIVRSDDFSFSTNGYDIYVYSSEKDDIGRLIFKDTNPNIKLNGKLLLSDTMPRIKNGRTLIPVRALAEKTGFEVSYDDIAKDIKITKEDKETIFTLGEKTAVSNGKEIPLEAAPEIINNRTLVPARAVTDAFGYDISWDEERRLVEITTE